MHCDASVISDVILWRVKLINGLLLETQHNRLEILLHIAAAHSYHKIVSLHRVMLSYRYSIFMMPLLSMSTKYNSEAKNRSLSCFSYNYKLQIDDCAFYISRMKFDLLLAETTYGTQETTLALYICIISTKITQVWLTK